MTKTIFYIAIGGASGSVLRYLTALLVNKYWHNNFPTATLITNILGCFLIGLFVGFITKNNLQNTNLNYFLITGFCGGFTTFSTFSQENYNLLQSQNPSTAALYIFASVGLGIFSVWLGLFIANS
jgi:fluoride exporter